MSPQQALTKEDAIVHFDDIDELLDLDAALTKFAVDEPELAKLVELRYFVTVASSAGPSWLIAPPTGAGRARDQTACERRISDGKVSSDKYICQGKVIVANQKVS